MIDINQSKKNYDWYFSVNDGNSVWSFPQTTLDFWNSLAINLN